MSFRTLLASCAALGALGAASALHPAPAFALIQEAPSAALSYPQTATVDHVDTYQSATRGEVEIADPYRWLEEDVRVSSDVADWVAAQNAVTNAYLETLPGRTMIAERLAELWDYERYGVPRQREGFYFFSRNDGRQDQSDFRVQEGLDGEARVLLDPNEWSDDGTVALAGNSPSPDGRHVAYMIQDGGSDWRTIRVVDVETGETLDDEIEWVKFSGVSWAKDGSGFYYSRFPQPAPGEEFTALNDDQTIYFHRLGTSQDEDELIHADPDNPEVRWGGSVSDDGDWLIIRSSSGTDGNAIHLLDLTDEDAEPVAVFEGFANNHSYVGNIGSRFFFLTDLDASNRRLVAIDANAPGEPEDVIGADERFPIRSVNHVGGHLIVQSFEDVQSVVRVYTPEGERVRDVELPGIGTVSGFSGDPDEPEAFFSYTSFDTPGTVYRYDVESGDMEVFREPELTFDPEDYTVSQVFYESTGGVEVPMFIVHRADIEPNGEQPTLLFGYGGFNISMNPAFDVRRLQWMEMGGVFALANLRGGSEYGRDWHDGGRLENKQNVFDDFINAGEHLIETGWTSADNLAIEGRSNGGLLIGAVANQRPDLFAAGLPTVGVMDMLRFAEFTAGRGWIDDYGNPQDPEMFDIIEAYSPLHNIADGEAYPALMTLTGDTDDRVVPSHSFKYTAAMQAANVGDAPQIIRIETRAGHGAGTPVSMLIRETADKWAFIAHHTGLDLSED